MNSKYNIIFPEYEELKSTNELLNKQKGELKGKNQNVNRKINE